MVVKSKLACSPCKRASTAGVSRRMVFSLTHFVSKCNRSITEQCIGILHNNRSSLLNTVGTIKFSHLNKLNFKEVNPFIKASLSASER